MWLARDQVPGGRSRARPGNGVRVTGLGVLVPDVAPLPGAVQLARAAERDRSAVPGWLVRWLTVCCSTMGTPVTTLAQRLALAREGVARPGGTLGRSVPLSGAPAATGRRSTPPRERRIIRDHRLRQPGPPAGRSA